MSSHPRLASAEEEAYESQQQQQQQQQQQLPSPAGSVSGPFSDENRASSHGHGVQTSPTAQQSGPINYSRGFTPSFSGFQTPAGAQTPGGSRTPGGSQTPASSWQGHTSWPGLPTMPSLMGFMPTSNSDGTPYPITPAIQPSSSDGSNNAGVRRRNLRFQSRMLKEGDVPHKPWLESKVRRRADRKAYWTFVGCAILGVAAAAGVVYSGVASVPNNSYCQILDEQFTGTELNTNVWFREQETGGFGNGEFEWTTDSTNNSYVRDGSLYILPTLTSDALGEGAITNGYDLNLTKSGLCTAGNKTDASCAVSSNATEGTILPPIQSARIITNFSTTIKYGRVEVKARMPTGDWIWPAVWMMPKDNVYGGWPRSGEIDIFESRGNNVTTLNADTSNRMHSTLHWGPDSMNNRYRMTTDNRQLYRNFYNQEFHTFGLEWTPEGIYTWEQSPVHKTFSYEFPKEGFWKKGSFGPTSTNGTALSDPWPNNSPAAPFDQEFFLILSVAVGGTNGWFSDEDFPNKPWSNSAEDNARNQFWAAKNEWYPTWPQGADIEKRAMVVDSVKVYQLEGVDGKPCPAP